MRGMFMFGTSTRTRSYQSCHVVVRVSNFLVPVSQLLQAYSEDLLKNTERFVCEALTLQRARNTVVDARSLDMLLAETFCEVRL